MVTEHDCAAELTQLRVERYAVQLFAGQRDMEEVQLRQEGEDMQPELVGQKQPLGVLLQFTSWCLERKKDILVRGTQLIDPPMQSLHLEETATTHNPSNPETLQFAQPPQREGFQQ